MILTCVCSARMWVLGFAQMQVLGCLIAGYVSTNLPALANVNNETLKELRHRSSVCPITFCPPRRSKAVDPICRINLPLFAGNFTGEKLHRMNERINEPKAEM